MLRLNVGCGATLLEGYVNLDGPWNAKADCCFDLEKCNKGYALPYMDDTFDELLMIHTIEHIHNLLPLMEELWRVAKPNALLGIRCPHGASDDADEDPTHVRRLFPRSFAAFGQPYYFKADYGYRGDWRCDEVRCFMRRDRVRGLSNVETSKILSTERNCVTEMVAELYAVKPCRKPKQGELKYPKILVELVGGSNG